MTLNGPASRFDVLYRGQQPPQGTALDAMSAGPNLVSTNASGSYVNIPADDDNIGNILEHAANTGVGLIQDPSTPGTATAVLVTTDGYDGCNPFDATCGTNAFTLAYFFKDYLNATSAMGMDQGGSVRTMSPFHVLPDMILTYPTDNHVRERARPGWDSQQIRVRHAQHKLWPISLGSLVHVSYRIAVICVPGSAFVRVHLTAELRLIAPTKQKQI
jgi:hypothetical protein